MELIYEYRSSFYTDGRSEKIVYQGREEFIRNFISQKELYEIFGGFILSENLKTNEEFIGVWGNRKCQKFRRLLREQKAEFKLLKNEIVEFRRIMTSVAN